MLPIVIPLRAEEDRDWKVQPTPLQPLTIEKEGKAANIQYNFEKK